MSHVSQLLSYKLSFLFNFAFFRPYVIDLESSNGTFVNNNKIEPRRYVELKEKVKYLMRKCLLPIIFLLTAGGH